MNHISCFIQLLLLLVSLIHFYNSRRTRHYYLTKSALLDPCQSPWQRLLLFGDENSFINLTGMTRQAFKLLEKVVFHNKHVGLVSIKYLVDDDEGNRDLILGKVP